MALIYHHQLGIRHLDPLPRQGPSPKGIYAGYGDRCVDVPVFACHQQAAIHSEGFELVERLIHQLPTVSQKQNTVPLLLGTPDDLTCDDRLARASRCL